MHDGLGQLLKRLRLSRFEKRRSNIEEAGDGGAEHQVVGESFAAMTVGAGSCSSSSHLMWGGCWSSTRELVAADSLSFAISAPEVLGGPRSGFGSRCRDLDEKLGTFTSLVMTHLVFRPVPESYFHPNNISGTLMMPTSVSRPGRVPNGEGSL